MVSASSGVDASFAARLGPQLLARLSFCQAQGLLNVRYGTQDRNGMLMYYVPLQAGMYKIFGAPFEAFWCCARSAARHRRLNHLHDLRRQWPARVERNSYR
jgi:hypothetical protein